MHFGAAESLSSGLPRRTPKHGYGLLKSQIAIPMAVAMGGNILLTIGAVVSAGIFGDHCSPLSDTTILSSMSVGTDLFSHVKTQLPYALVTAACATALYVVFGFVM